MEIIFLLVWKMRQNIEFQTARSTLQALLNQKGAEPKHIEDAFEDLKNSFFPFEKNQKKQEIGALRQAMMREIARGALSVTPMADPDRRKMANRLVRGQERLAVPRRPAFDLSKAKVVPPPRGPRRRTG
jgi:hypothetical protein